MLCECKTPFSIANRGWKKDIKKQFYSLFLFPRNKSAVVSHLLVKISSIVICPLGILCLKENQELTKDMNRT